MSTELTPIIGRIEISDIEKRQSNYRQGELMITSFSGGLGAGPMLQLTTPIGYDHIQLTKDQVKNLLQTLSEWLD